MRFAKVALLILTLLSPGICQQPDQQPSLPVTDAGIHVAAYLQAFNAADDKAMSDFFASHASKEGLRQTPAAQRLSRFRQMKQRLGSLALVKVLESSESMVSTVMQAKEGGLVQLDFEFEQNPPHGLLGIRVQDVEGGGRGEAAVNPMRSETEALHAARTLLDSLAKIDEFSGAILVARNGNVLYEHAYGYADQEHKIANRVDTKFNIGSMNKTFTSLAIHQLVTAGKITLADHIGTYLPDYPNKTAAEQVTIQQLLDMTSGIGDFFGDRYMAEAKEHLRTITSYLPLFADKPLEFKPGARRRYSNGGFVVVGAIIEKVSGQDYYTYVREHIFLPIGMTETDSYEKDKQVPNRALGYTREGEEAKAPRHSNYETLPARGSSAGGGYSTLHDLLKYLVALHEGKIGTRETQGGFAIAGGAPGLNGCIEWNPRSGYAVIALANYDPPAAENVATQIAKWLPR